MAEYGAWRAYPDGALDDPVRLSDAKADAIAEAERFGFNHERVEVIWNRHQPQFVYDEVSGEYVFTGKHQDLLGWRAPL